MSRTILAVDNEPAILRIVEEILVPSDYHVEKATCGKDALKLARKLQPDLILLDILMPDMNGYEVLEALKQQEQTMSIPVIMLSGLGDDHAKVRSAELYSESYLTKPFAADDLLAKIAEVLRRQGK